MPVSGEHRTVLESDGTIPGRGISNRSELQGLASKVGTWDLALVTSSYPSNAQYTLSQALLVGMAIPDSGRKKLV